MTAILYGMDIENSKLYSATYVFFYVELKIRSHIIHFFVQTFWGVLKVNKVKNAIKFVQLAPET